MRQGSWIQTFTGKAFYPLDPRSEDINSADIAHALSMLCRFGGHCVRFYSVAEHCVLLARAMPPVLRLWALLHDASEAYLVDVPRPIKPHLKGYREAEDRIQAAIFAHFGLAGPLPQEVKDADYAMLMAERVNMRASDQEWTNPVPPLTVELQYWSPKTAESVFLNEFRELSGQ